MAQGNFNDQLNNIIRKRAFADMLRKQGQELSQGLGQTQMVSGRAVPNSGWGSANAIISQLLGAYMDKKYAGEQEDAKTQQVQDMKQWASALQKANVEAQRTPESFRGDMIDPVQVTATPRGDSPESQAIQNRITSLNTQAQQDIAANDAAAQAAPANAQNAYMQALLSGQDIGGMAEQIASAQMADMLGPKAPVSVSRGATLVDPRSGNVVYQSPYEPGTSGGMTGSLQELSAINADRVAAGKAPISAEEYLRERRQNTTDLQLYRTYVAQAQARGETPMSEAQFAAQRVESEAGAKTTGAGMAERQLDMPRAAAMYEQSSANFSRLYRAAENLHNDEALWKGVGKGKYASVSVIPGNEGRDIRARIENLQSQVGFMVLQDMRNASKTGGALGQVTERELQFLQDNLASLSTDQSPEQFQESLGIVMEYMREAQGRLDRGWRRTYPGVDTWGRTPEEAAAPEAQTPIAPTGAPTVPTQQVNPTRKPLSDY